MIHNFLQMAVQPIEGGTLCPRGSDSNRLHISDILFLSIFLCFTGVACGSAAAKSNPVTTVPVQNQVPTPQPGAAIASIFNSAAPTPETCTGDCKGIKKYDLTLDPLMQHCITRITDGTSDDGKSIGNMTHSGGDFDFMSSLQGDYISVVMEGGFVQIYSATVDAQGCLTLGSQVTGPAVSGPFSFARTNDTTFYYVTSFDTIWKGTIDPATNTYSVVEVVQLFAPGVCPGDTSFVPQTGSILNVEQNDKRFAMAIGPGDQGSADEVFVYDLTSGCLVVNLHTSQWWKFCQTNCTGATPAYGTLSAAGCSGSDGAIGHGIHDVEMSGSGEFLLVTLQPPGVWNYGVCTDSTIADQFTVWQIDTANTQWAYATSSLGMGGPQFGAHPSEGITHVLTPYWGGPNIRENSTLGSFTTFAEPPTMQDVHCSWHPNDKSLWICASDDMTVAQGSVYAPPSMQNVVFTWDPLTAYPPGTPSAQLFHTFSCGAPGGANCTNGPESGFGGQFSIGYATQTGNYFCWAGSMLGSLGNDINGKPRIDGWCGKIQR